MNKADSEAMAGLLEAAGFSQGDVGILIINTCTVKTPTENKILRRLRGLSGKKVIVSGCLPAASPEIAEKFPNFSFLGLNVEDVVEAMKAAERGERFLRIGAGGCRLTLPRKRVNPVVEIVPIAQGCVGDCSYCITRFARGGLVSYSKDLILGSIQKAVSEGAGEVWLTAQDTGAYGRDIGANLPSLLKAISSLEEDFHVRVGMMNPSHVLGFLDELIEAFDNEKFYRFLHLPLQSGDDTILSGMNRGYSAADFLRIVRGFRKKMPDLTLATDVIVGYPGEDEEAFENTLKVIEESRPDVLNISRYWARPKTRAAEMKQFPGRITKQRSRRMNELFRKISLENNRKWVGWSGQVLVSERVIGGYCARNLSYKPVVIRSTEDLFGRKLQVSITAASVYYLRGVLLPQV
jgi:MiaB-like tRNA modifying enzyme